VEKEIMKRSSTIFLQAVIVLIGIAAFVFLLWEPHIEGRNAHATLFEIYFNDPFLAWAYSASIAFFVALYQAFKLLRDVRLNKIFSLRSLRALRTIKYCGIVLIGFVAVGVAYLFIMVRGEDDIAGGVAMGNFVALISTAIAIAAAVFERNLKIRMS
jgi:Protein of unknown function (DUF2975)